MRCALIAACILSLAAWAQESSDPGTAAVIRALEKQWTVGQARNDNRALDMIFDNALVYVEYGRVVSKGEYLSRIKAQPTNLDQISMEPMTVRTFGNTAIVVGSYTGEPHRSWDAKPATVEVRGYVGVQEEGLGSGCGCGRSGREVNGTHTLEISENPHS